MKYVKNWRKHKIVIGTLLTAAIIVGILATNTKASTAAPYYSCIYSEARGRARCSPIADIGACMGAYSLRGQNIKDGINLDGGDAATCEGLSADQYYIFDKSGSYIKTVKSSDPLLDQSQ